MKNHVTHRTGSIYVLTLLTVAAIGSMVLIGATLRSATSGRSMIVERMNKNASGVMDATELALAQIVNDPNEWVTSSQSGAVFSELKLGDRTYSSLVRDADTLSTPTGTTTNYRVTVTSRTGIVKESAAIDVHRVRFEYHEYLESLGLDAYWPLDEPSMSSTAAEPEDGRDGTYLAPSSAGAGTSDEGWFVPVFTGSNDHVVTPYDSAYQDNEEGTVSFWVKLTGASNVTTYGLFGQRYRTNAIPAVTMTCTAGSLRVYLDDSGSFSFGQDAQTSAGIIQRNQWHHVAMTWGPAGLRIYVDGVLEAARWTNTDYWDTHDDSQGQQPLLIGASYITESGSVPLVGFEGSIARFAILSDQLEASTIAELASIKPDENEIQLVEQSWTRVYE